VRLGADRIGSAGREAGVGHRGRGICWAGSGIIMSLLLLPYPSSSSWCAIYRCMGGELPGNWGLNYPFTHRREFRAWGEYFG